MFIPKVIEDIILDYKKQLDDYHIGQIEKTKNFHKKLNHIIPNIMIIDDKLNLVCNNKFRLTRKNVSECNRYDVIIIIVYLEFINENNLRRIGSYFELKKKYAINWDNLMVLNHNNIL